MKNSNTRKSAQLGMPFGTAANRLRKMVFFNLLQKYGEDLCFKCGVKIATVEELSLEHKRPWEGRDTALFWDLSNIAFSHLRCNRPSRTAGQALRKVGGDGMSWCTIHQEFHHISNFQPDKNRWNGLRNECRDGHVERRRATKLRRKSEINGT
jgi:hypothetical protein